MAKARVVADIMIRNPIALQEEADLWTLQEEMHNFDLHHIPVLDGKQLVGIVSQNDLLRFTTNALHRDSVHSALDARDKHSRFVASIMTTEVVTIAPGVALREAAQRLVNTRATVLPVVEADGTLVGVVSEKEVLRGLLDE